MSSRSVVIIGGGIAGVALAWRLAAGSRVVLIEREEGLGYHATGRSAAEWSLVHAEGLTRSITAASGAFFNTPPSGFSDLALLRRRGNVVYARPGEGSALADLLDHAREFQPDIEAITPRTAGARAPFLDPSALEAAFWDPLNGEIEVDALMTACRRAAAGAGAAFWTGAAFLGAERRRGKWVVATSRGGLEADVLVNAAGPWADEVAQLCGAAPLGLAARRRSAVTFDPPTDLDVRGLPSADDAASGFYIKPEAGRLMACPGDATPSAPCDARPEEIDVATAAWMAGEVMGCEIRRLGASWAGLRTYAPDQQPVAGWDATVDGLFWLAGLGGGGLMTAPALSAAAAGILESGEAPAPLARDGINAAALSPSRF
jgi:D-arginine dehydrogenase